MSAKTCRDFGYVADDRWAKMPPGYSWPDVAGLATDSRDNLFVFNRGDHPVVVFDRAGNFLRSWGEGQFVRPHGLTIGPDDAVYCSDDLGHVVRKYTLEGKLLLTLGTGKPSDTGATSMDFRTIQRGAPPFHYPTNLALAPGGEMYVSDGYGNARVHKFAPDGHLLLSWGEPGAGPGQFNLPHGIAVDAEERVYVADRENSRVQIFNRHGQILGEWTDVARPCQVRVMANGDLMIAELGFRAAMWPGVSPPPNPTGGRLSIFDADGKLKARWGGGDTPCAAGDFFAPHDVCVDSRGDIYVGEVTWSGGAKDGVVPADCHSLQKFTKM